MSVYYRAKSWSSELGGLGEYRLKSRVECRVNRVVGRAHQEWKRGLEIKCYCS